MPCNVCEPIITTTVAPCEFFVVDPHEMQNRGVKVIDVNRLLDRSNAMLVSRSMDITTPYTCSGQP